MKLSRFFPFLITGGIILFFSLSCDMDPWTRGVQGKKSMNALLRVVQGEKSTDKVTITKTTKYGKSADGVTPLKSQLGPVVMSHKTHEDMGMACTDCHHKEANDGRIKKCAASGCHTGFQGYETLHGLCVDCHIKVKDGPQKCMECH